MRVIGTKNYKFRGLVPIVRGDEFITRDRRGKISSVEKVVGMYPSDSSIPHYIDVEVTVPSVPVE